ncbi:hypothetical protein MKX03_002354, partial [Papaver bracteatum]
RCFPHNYWKGLDLENANVKTQRGFDLVDERMQVIDKDGKDLYRIGDAREWKRTYTALVMRANGKLMLVHVASAQGIS